MREIRGIDRAMAVLKPHWEEIEDDFHRHNARFLQLASTDHDAIGRVLRSHLVVENFMNSYLTVFFGIEDFDELRLTFAQKAKMLPAGTSSASFVRPGIIQLNKVRNKFGHQLNHVVASSVKSAGFVIADSLAVPPSRRSLPVSDTGS